MNLPTLKVMACPVNAGRHSYHDNRWIVTSDAVVEWNTSETEWRLKEGSLICEMRDCQNQEHLALLFSSAHELLEALEALLADAVEIQALRQSIHQRNGTPFTPSAKIEQARAAIRKARGE